MRLHLFCAVIVLVVAAAYAEGAVGLVTIPERETVRMTIYNSVDLTLVQEARTLVLKKGRNRIQYQWAGTLIDTTSLELRAVERQTDIEIVDVVYPPASPATLVWELESAVEGPVRFEISYFTSGVTWNADYVVRAGADERTGDVEGWVAVDNRSGENYPLAEVRLVVGTINLVERIRDLATGQESERTRALDRAEISDSRSVLSEKKAADGAPAPAAFAARAKRPEVLSVRLADYHIFTISGVQAVANGATTRFLAISTPKAMDIEVLYRVSFRSEAAQKLYRFINDADHGLPDGPLPEGVWNVFRVIDPASRALSFSGSARHAYVPPGEKVELELGSDPAIVVKQVHEAYTQSDHHYDQKGRLDGWIDHDRWRFKLVNTKAIPVSLEYLIGGAGDWSVDGLSGERRSETQLRHQDRIAGGAVLDLGPFTINSRKGARGNAPLPPPKPPMPQPLPIIHTSSNATTKDTP
jgi:hypothetical protein